jgi:hypothetical protein
MVVSDDDGTDDLDRGTDDDAVVVVKTMRKARWRGVDERERFGRRANDRTTTTSHPPRRRVYRRNRQKRRISG